MKELSIGQLARQVNVNIETIRYTGPKAFFVVGVFPTRTMATVMPCADNIKINAERITISISGLEYLSTIDSGR